MPSRLNSAFRSARAPSSPGPHLTHLFRSLSHRVHSPMRSASAMPGHSPVHLPGRRSESVLSHWQEKNCPPHAMQCATSQLRLCCVPSLTPQSGQASSELRLILAMMALPSVVVGSHNFARVTEGRPGPDQREFNFLIVSPFVFRLSCSSFSLNLPFM